MHSASVVSSGVLRSPSEESAVRASVPGALWSSASGLVAAPQQTPAETTQHALARHNMTQPFNAACAVNAVSPSGSFASNGFLSMQSAAAGQSPHMPLPLPGASGLAVGSMGSMGHPAMHMHPGSGMGSYNMFAPRTPPVQQRAMYPMPMHYAPLPLSVPQPMMHQPVQSFSRPVYPMPQRRDSLAALLSLNNSPATSLTSSASTSPHSAPRTPLVPAARMLQDRLTAAYQARSGSGATEGTISSPNYADGRDSLDNAAATPEVKSVPKLANSHAPKTRPLNKFQVRVKLACVSCKTSKTKCDDERPCRRCVRTDRAATCHDSEKTAVEPTEEMEDEAAAAAAAAAATALRKQEADAAAVTAAQDQPSSASTSTATAMSISSSPTTAQTPVDVTSTPAPNAAETVTQTSSGSSASGSGSGSGSFDPAVAALTMLSTPPASAPGSPKPEHPQPAVDAAEDRPSKKLKSFASNDKVEVKPEPSPSATVSTDSGPAVKVEIDINAPAAQVAPAAVTAAAAAAVATSGLVSLDSVPRPNPWMPTTTLSRSWCDTWTSVSTSHLDIWREHLNARSAAAQSSNQAERELQSLAVQRFTWLERSFNFLNVCVAGMPPPPSPVPVTNMSGVLALESLEVPKSLYSQLNLGVVLFPLGQPPFATNALPWCNQALANFLGFANGEELVATLGSIDGIASLYHASNLCSALPTFIDAVMEGRPNYSLRSRWKHRAGNLVDMLESLNLTFEAANGHVLYFASLMQPIPGPMSNVGATVQQVQQQMNQQQLPQMAPPQMQAQPQQQQQFTGLQQSMIPQQLPPHMQMMPQAQHFHFNVALQPPPPSLPFYYSSPNQPQQQQQVQQQQPQQQQELAAMQMQQGGFQSSAYSSFPMQSAQLSGGGFSQFNVGSNAFARPMQPMQQQQTPPSLLKSFSAPIPAGSLGTVAINPAQ